MKKIIAVVSTIIFLFVAFWLGEAGRGLFQIYPCMIGLIGIVTVSFIMYRGWKYRTVAGSLFIVFYTSAFYMGDLSFYRAYNNCLEEAENIRSHLAEYKMNNGRYPDVLDDLDVKLPCSRCLRDTILEYESTGINYKIWFKDWLVEYVATDKEPFLAHK